VSGRIGVYPFCLQAGEAYCRYFDAALEKLVVGLFQIDPLPKNCLYYKYGASEAQFHNSGAMQLLLWHAIQDAVRGGLEELDMGRSACDDTGLAAFKERLGAVRFPLPFIAPPSNRRSQVPRENGLARLPGSRATICRTAV
jgi:hypothetical protein